MRIPLLSIVRLGILSAILFLGPCLSVCADSFAWITNTSMNAGHFIHQATLLNDDRVFVTGGFNNSSAELFDPATGVWTAMPPMTAARQAHTVSTFSCLSNAGIASRIAAIA